MVIGTELWQCSIGNTDSPSPTLEGLKCHTLKTRPLELVVIVQLANSWPSIHEVLGYYIKLGIRVYVFNPNTEEVEVGR